MPLYTVPTTQTYRADDDAARYFTEGTLIDETEAVRFNMPGATSVAAVGDSVNGGRAVRAVTASADGSGDAIIPAGTDVVTVTSAGSARIVTLPAPVVGAEISLRNGATGYELRTSDPETIAINGGLGVAAESAIPANTLVTCVCDTATTYLCRNTDVAGAVTATEVAAP